MPTTLEVFSFVSISLSLVLTSIAFVLLLLNYFKTRYHGYLGLLIFYSPFPLLFTRVTPFIIKDVEILKFLLIFGNFLATIGAGFAFYTFLLAQFGKLPPKTTIVLTILLFFTSLFVLYPDFTQVTIENGEIITKYHVLIRISVILVLLIFYLLAYRPYVLRALRKFPYQHPRLKYIFKNPYKRLPDGSQYIFISFLLLTLWSITIFFTENPFIYLVIRPLLIATSILLFATTLWFYPLALIPTLPKIYSIQLFLKDTKEEIFSFTYDQQHEAINMNQDKKVTSQVTEVIFNGKSTFLKIKVEAKAQENMKLVGNVLIERLEKKYQTLKISSALTEAILNRELFAVLRNTLSLE